MDDSAQPNFCLNTTRGTTQCTTMVIRRALRLVKGVGVAREAHISAALAPVPDNNSLPWQRPM